MGTVGHSTAASKEVMSTMKHPARKPAAKPALVLTIASALLLEGCSLPVYAPKSAMTIPIEVRGTDGSGLILIQKLNANCEPEARFETAIGANPRFMRIDAEPEFSFKLVTWPTLCVVQNTLALDNREMYRIHLDIPSPTAQQWCSIRAEGGRHGSAFPGPARLTGKCGSNRREGLGSNPF